MGTPGAARVGPGALDAGPLRSRVPALSALVLALVVVAVHALVATQVPAARFLKYPLAARAHFEGGAAVERITDWSPLYFRLTWLAELAGLDSATLWPRAQIALAGVAAAAVFLALRTRFSAGLSFVGAALVGFDRQTFVLARIAEPELLLLALVALLLAALAHGRLPLAATAGALAVATRPSALGILVLCAAGAAWSRDGIPAWPPVRRHALALLAPVALLGLLLALESRALTGRFAWARMNAGTVFFEGNGAWADGRSARYPEVVRALAESTPAEPDPEHAAYRAIARAETGEPQLAPDRVNRLWAARALAFVADHPGHALLLARTKLADAFHRFAWHDVPQAARLDERLAGAPLPPYALVAALALLGFALEARHFGAAFPAYALFVAQLATMLLFYGSARQRFVLLPALAWFACVTIEALSDGGRGRAVRAALAAAIGLLAFSLARDSADELGERQERRATERAQQRLDLAFAARARGDQAAFARAGGEAIAHGARSLDRVALAFLPQEPEPAVRFAARRIEELLDVAPGPASVPPEEAFALALDAATLRLALGEPALALARLDAGRSAPGPPPEPREAVLRARALALLDRQEAARRTLRETLARRPGHPRLLAELAALGASAEAATARALLSRYAGDSEARLLLGESLFALERTAEARDELAPLIERLPALRAATTRLAIAEIESGRRVEGLRRLELLADDPHPFVVEPLRTARALCRGEIEPAQGEAAARRARLLARAGFSNCAPFAADRGRPG